METGINNIATSGDQAVPVVCIGMSAGGLKPLQTILQQLSPATGMAFVLVCHLSRTEPTFLPRLISNWSRMPAGLVQPGELLEPNHIYVIPPGQEITIEDEHFGVQPRSKRYGWSNVITLFLNSLVRSRKPPGIAVILSGDDSDGAAALGPFHNSGGITIAQDVRSAKNKSMPRSAIGTGFVDYVLLPEAVAGALETIARDCAVPEQCMPGRSLGIPTEASALPCHIGV